MLSISMKKTAVSILICVLLISAVSFTAYANEREPMASEYIRSTSVELISIGNGQLIAENMLGATRIVDKLGIKTLEIQKKVNGYWQAAYTLKNQYQYNTGTFVLDLLYYGTPGAEYRSYVEFYVEDDGGSETKLIVSSPVVAQ